MSLKTDQIQAALVQMLENFQRCGITRFGSQPTSALSAEMLARLADGRQAELSNVANQTAIAPTSVSVSTSPTNMPAPTSRADSHSAPPGQPRPLAPLMAAAPLAGGVQVGEAWSLPVLPIEQRQQRFDTLAEQVRDCRRCAAIVGYRQQTVFGDGNLHPTVCFVGEAPGADEDRTGLPFVGKAGQLLTKIIQAMKLRREEVYILNALKCRPPQNRTPINEEIDHCRHFVESQLDILQPQFIVCLGAVAVRSILRQDGSIGGLRGKFHHYRGARVVVTYHPSYLLRNESAKKLVWEDMKMLMAELPQ
jgi:uracil-DNA glycosylase